MEFCSLYDLLTFLEYGTKLRIGILFLGAVNDKLKIPYDRSIHDSVICRHFKLEPEQYKRCYRCRNAALKNAQRKKIGYGAECINGIYEYTKPVYIDDELYCIIFIGNISNGSEKLQRIDKSLTDTLEKDFDRSKCEKLSTIIESYIASAVKLLPKVSDSENPLIDNIRQYISENIEFDVDFSDIASIFHYNEKYLGRLFKFKTGVTFKEYMNSLRISKAKVLLKESKMSIIDISAKSGFNNVTYFNRLFKRAVGVTPGQYRKSR